MTENWTELYQSALLELEHSLLNARIYEAREAIAERLEVLRGMPGLHTEEQQAIQDAFSSLRVLEHEEPLYADKKEEHKAAQAALETLRSIAPTVERLKLNLPSEGK